MSLRVLHVTNAYPYDQVPEYGVFVKEQIESLDNSIETKVIFINGRKIGKTAYFNAIGEIRRQARYFDIIHCHHLYSMLSVSASFTRKPLVLSFLNDWLHEMDGCPSTNVRRIVCNLAVRMADEVIFKSPIPKQFEQNPHFHYLPNGADSEKFDILDQQKSRDLLGLNHSTKYVLFVSSKDKYRKQKRYDKFLETLDIMRRSCSKFDIQELVLVNQPRERVVHYFNAADVHLLCSDFEGSPNSVKEALCCGVPVVTTNVGNVVDLLREVPDCTVSDYGTAAELADLALRTLNKSVNRVQIRNGFLSKSFSKAKTSEKLSDLYRSMVS